MALILSSKSDDDKTAPIKLFAREKPIHELLGGGKVADVLLWKDKSVSAGLLIGVAVIWYLFEVVEYNLVTLLCHFFITTMLVIFIWSTGAEFFKWKRPEVPKIVLQESTFNEVASAFHTKFNNFLSKFLHIACGNDVKLFFMILASLSLLSLIGNYVSVLNLLFFGLVFMETLPYLYEQYEKEVDYATGKLHRRIRKTFKNFDSTILDKIPRGPIKDKKAN